jgi:HAD superfamily hydrolase (TIGR01509 family)
VIAHRLVRRPSAAIFDMDGLMLDTEPLAARAWTEAACGIGIAFDASVTPRLVGRTFSDCRRLIADHHGDAYPVDTLMDAWHAAYDAIVAREGIVLKPGLLELLDWLERQRIPKAVATSTRRTRAEAKLERCGLIERFSAVVGGDDVARGKPAPDIFLAAAAKLARPPAECVVLEDSEPGMQAAAAAGIPVIIVPDTHAAPNVIGAGAPLVVSTLVHVRDHLAALPSERGSRVR